MEKPLKSPCISLCALDENDMCVGCQRTGDEVIRWGRMTNDERREVLAKLAVRAQQQGMQFGKEEE